MGDSNAAEHTVLTKHTMAIVAPSSSYYTAAVEKTVVADIVVYTTSMVVVHTVVEVMVAPATAAVTVPLGDPLPSHNTRRMFSPGVVRMRDNIYLHAQHIHKMSSIGLSASSPSSACIHIPHVNAHILDKCSTMVHCHNLKGSLPLTTDSFRNMGKYPWYVHPCDTECTGDPCLVPSPY